MGFSFGISVAVPDSFVYRFFKETREVRVLKSRTIQVIPEDLNDVVGKLREYEGEEDVNECGDYEDDTILLISSSDWRKFSQKDCSLRAAIIKIDDDLKHRSSGPLSLRAALIKIDDDLKHRITSNPQLHYPIVLMYDDDVTLLGKKLSNIFHFNFTNEAPHPDKNYSICIIKSFLQLEVLKWV